jgi:Anaphase-promoting complex APC subunit CDC26
MLRRPPTTIGITVEDIALFESQYAQGHIYRSHTHQESNQTDSNGQSGTQGQQHDVDTPENSREEDADSMVANPGEYADGPVGQSHASGNRNRNRNGEHRRIKTREQRIHGSAVAAAAAAASAAATAAAAASAYAVASGVGEGGGVVGGAGEASGGATRVAGPAQQHQYQTQYQQR